MFPPRCVTAQVAAAAIAVGAVPSVALAAGARAANGPGGSMVCPAADQSAGADAIDVEIRLDTSLQTEDEERMRGALCEAAVGRAPDVGLNVETGAGARALFVIGWRNQDAGDYSIRVEVLVDGVPVSPAIPEQVCETCGMTDMGERVAGLMPEVAGKIREAQRGDPGNGTDGGNGTPKNGEGNGHPPDNGNKPTKKKGIGLLAAGGAVGGVGLGVLIGGIVVIAQGEEVDSNNPSQSEDRGPLGIGLAVGGAIGLATGVALMAIGGVRLKKSKTALVPTIGPQMTGLSIVGRF